MLVVQSEGVGGTCGVETKNLDGETNLKFREVPKGLLTGPADLHSLHSKLAKITVENPNNRIYTCNGKIEFNDTTICPISNDNVMLRGMTLKNTPSIVACVLYTGKDTKI